MAPGVWDKGTQYLGLHPILPNVANLKLIMSFGIRASVSVTTTAGAIRAIGDLDPAEDTSPTLQNSIPGDQILIMHTPCSTDGIWNRSECHPFRRRCVEVQNGSDRQD